MHQHLFNKCRFYNCFPVNTGLYHSRAPTDSRWEYTFKWHFPNCQNWDEQSNIWKNWDCESRFLFGTNCSNLCLGNWLKTVNLMKVSFLHLMAALAEVTSTPPLSIIFKCWVSESFKPQNLKWLYGRWFQSPIQMSACCVVSSWLIAYHVRLFNFKLPSLTIL